MKEKRENEIVHGFWRIFDANIFQVENSIKFLYWYEESNKNKKQKINKIQQQTKKQKTVGLSGINRFVV